MSNSAETRRMTAAEYLVWEREQTNKHEFHDGEVFAMAGGSRRHNFLSLAIGAELRAGLRGKGCHVLSADQRIAIDEGARYVYADAVAECVGAQSKQGEGDVLTHPSVVVEVLSRSTESYDRGDNWTAYQRLQSLTDYVLVSQAAVRIEHFRRETDGSWCYRALGAGDLLALAGGATIAVDAVYEGAFDLEGD